jgi:tRNA(adenine34) deaminase
LRRTVPGGTEWLVPRVEEPDAAAERWMARALTEARNAERRGEVPVGAVVVIGETLVARAHNATIRANDPTAHAELIALRRAARRLGLPRLNDAELYVTLEPCSMCAGAMIQARISTLTFACRDPKAGAIVSLYALASDRRLNHRFAFREGVLADEARDLLRSFFRARRATQVPRPFK